MMFIYQGGLVDVNSEAIAKIPLNLDSVKFPVSITAFPDGETYRLTVEYDSWHYWHQYQHSHGYDSS